MKAPLEFNLPKEQSEYDACSHGMDWALLVQDLNNKLHTLYNDVDMDDDALEHIDKVMSIIHEEMMDRGLTFPV